MKKILIIFGTRPEAIKISPLITEFSKFSDQFNIKVGVTAQHREMLDQVLDIFGILPDYDLNVMAPKQDLYHITSRILLEMKGVLERCQPDLLMVHGDTTTTFASTLAAFYQQIPVAHVEAGLRTGNIYSPWPEEANRQLTTQLAKFHFAPTLKSQENLLKENVSDENVIVTGNTVIDALLSMVNKIKANKNLANQLMRTINQAGYPLNMENKKQSRLVLITGHRRENFGDGFLNICHAIKQLAMHNEQVDFVYPVHLNPNVKKPVNEILSGLNNVFLINPLDYASFTLLMSRSYLILTDSGGIQEEAPTLGIPVLVMRHVTERPEAIAAGTAKLVSTSQQTIITEVQELLHNQDAYNRMSRQHNPYGDGTASQKIVTFLQQRL